jgi:hypothetical protein
LRRPAHSLRRWLVALAVSVLPLVVAGCPATPGNPKQNPYETGGAPVSGGPGQRPSDYTTRPRRPGGNGPGGNGPGMPGGRVMPGMPGAVGNGPR